MNVFGRILGIVGVVLIVVALALLFGNIITINKLFAVASALNRSSVANPASNVMLTFGLVAIGGLLAGAGGAMLMRRRG
ncbi:hypothetical protein [Deinococcus sp.]|uniref:hypothetical protein n=1 Tax=Deinococcus sp. TaxID=47478 RepID=UPI003B58F536